MARRTKKEVEQGTINIKYAPMNVKGDTAFKCINDDWGVIAFDIRRAQLEDASIQFGDKELQHNCIYFLIGRDGLTEKVYVGQAKKRNGSGSVLKRLREHANSMTEAYRNIWNRVIVVTGKDDTWGPTELNALEHIFYNTIPAENNLNGNNPNAGIEDLEQFDEKVKQIELYLATLKVGIFSGTDDSEKVTVQSVTNEYSKTEDLQNGMARIPEIVTPQRIVKSMVDLLPADVWNPETTFLDPACKGGEFLKEIYDRLMGAETMKALYPNEFARANHILSKQIFGISLSEVSKKRTTDTLNGFGYNIKIIDGYISKLKGIGLGSKADGTHRTMRDILNEEFGQVKFDVVIGNPPYQESTGEKARAVPIYQKFVNNGFVIANTVCMITPSRWFSASDSSSKEMRERILCDNTSIISHYTNSNYLFSGVTLNGGISYFCTNKERHGKTKIKIDDKLESEEMIVESSIFIPSKCYRRLVHRVHGTKKFIDTSVFSQNMFGLDTNFFGLIGDIKVRTSRGISDGIDKDDVPKGMEHIHKYKVITGTMNTTSIINNPEILDRNTICTRTYTVLGVYDTQEEAYRVKKFFMTKFIRALIASTLNNQMVSRDNYRYVPLQDFTSNSDIDWSQSVADIDKQLYKKYDLTQEEIDYIEKTIKPME